MASAINNAKECIEIAAAVNAVTAIFRAANGLPAIRECHIFLELEVLPDKCVSIRNRFPNRNQVIRTGNQIRFIGCTFALKRKHIFDDLNFDAFCRHFSATKFTVRTIYFTIIPLCTYFVGWCEIYGFISV